jgi:hypothetical protein
MLHAKLKVEYRKVSLHRAGRFPEGRKLPAPCREVAPKGESFPHYCRKVAPDHRCIRKPVAVSIKMQKEWQYLPFKALSSSQLRKFLLLLPPEF